jgi:hypothetical protein
MKRRRAKDVKNYRIKGNRLKCCGYRIYAKNGNSLNVRE